MQKHQKKRSFPFFFGLVLFVVALVGCGDSATAPVEAPENKRLGQTANTGNFSNSYFTNPSENSRNNYSYDYDYDNDRNNEDRDSDDIDRYDDSDDFRSSSRRRRTSSTVQLRENQNDNILRALVAIAQQGQQVVQQTGKRPILALFFPSAARNYPGGATGAMVDVFTGNGFAHSQEAVTRRTIESMLRALGMRSSGSDNRDLQNLAESFGLPENAAASVDQLMYALGSVAGDIGVNPNTLVSCLNGSGSAACSRLGF